MPPSVHATKTLNNSPLSKALQQMDIVNDEDLRTFDEIKLDEIIKGMFMWNLGAGTAAT